MLAFRNSFALRHIDASVLEIARAALLDARIELCERAEGLIASVLRGQAVSLGVAPTLSPRKTQHADVLGLAALMASEPYNVPTWRSTLHRRWRNTRLPLAPCRVRGAPSTSSA
jgi:hypothetical protein